MINKGFFIAIEGSDGGGKTTQAGRLCAFLKSRGREVVPVREPGGTSLGERVRMILLDPAMGVLESRTELFLFMACRAELVDKVIRPALDRGAVVVSDRYLLSTLVYQGLAGGLPVEEVRAVGRVTTRGLAPDLTLLLDLPAEEGMARLGETRDRIEQKGLPYLRAIRQGYLDLSKSEPGLVRIDAARSEDDVARAIEEAVLRALR
jgi:dTMP kinase